MSWFAAAPSRSASEQILPRRVSPHGPRALVHACPPSGVTVCASPQVHVTVSPHFAGVETNINYRTHPASMSLELRARDEADGVWRETGVLAVGWPLCMTPPPIYSRPADAWVLQFSIVNTDFGPAS